MAKGTAIPIRFEAEDAALIELLEKQTGLVGPEIVRRAVRLFYQEASRRDIQAIIHETVYGGPDRSPLTDQREISVYIDDSANAGVTSGVSTDNEPVKMLLPVDWKLPADFAVKIRGDSMTPMVNDGDFAAFIKSDRAKTGDIVVAVVDSQMMLKLYRDTGGVKKLVSINPKYPPIPYRDDVRIQGIFQGVIPDLTQ